MRVTINTAQKVNVSRKITKAKLSKSGGLDVVFDESVLIVDSEGETIELTREPSVACRNLVDDDLLHAFDLLRPHLAIICDQVEANGKTLYELDDEPNALDNFKVISFSIGGSGEHEGVTLSGYKRLRGGRVLNLNSPFTKYLDENEPYEYAEELNQLINHCSNEVLAYLDGKIKPNAQGELFDENGDAKEDFD